jgi:hypothetical protein
MSRICVLTDVEAQEHALGAALPNHKAHRHVSQSVAEKLVDGDVRRTRPYPNPEGALCCPWPPPGALYCPWPRTARWASKEQDSIVTSDSRYSLRAVADSSDWKWRHKQSGPYGPIVLQVQVNDFLTQHKSN